ncbi:CocE/NonD family hydrolase [Aeromicrobium sp.]|uniref:CocE/NonD family hydrolase n=1 Tax=Aeromicrobium sp. TaxID=1871063 RepID=UPI002FC7B08C
MRSARSYLLALLGVGLAATALVQPAQAADPVYTVQALHFKVLVGPANDVPCSIVGDLYLPKSASSTKKVPAILTTNGFGGSKSDQAGLGKTFASRGYAVLSYSGLGFGGSGCKITLDDPDWDGKAASQLVSYLGGKTGIAFTDAAHTTPAKKLGVVRLDATNHLGVKVANDPRVGMVGGSYGGQIQFAAASVDPRIDTIIPIITWSDLSYSLSPNNTSQISGVQTSTPGAAKLIWALGFTGLGIVNGLQNAQVDPSRLIPCPNYATFVCPAVATAGVLGTVDASTTANLRHASVSSYFKKIKIPTLIIQGLSDTLFNINEGVANYQALQKQGTPTKMIWYNGGHSGPSAPGELTIGNPNPASEHLSKSVANWFDHYLKGSSVSTGPEFSYFRNWVKYTGIATPAYGTATSYPVGTATKYYLSGTKLTTSSTGIASGTQSFLTPPAGLPTSTDPTDVTALPLPEIDLPGTSASWSTPTLTNATNVVGQPKLTIKVNAALAQATQTAGTYGSLVLFVKIADVDATGKATIIRNLVAPVRVPDVSKPFTVTLPGIVHQFAKGHTLKLIVAGGSTNYRGGLIPNPVTITTGTTGQVLTLPIVK